MIIKNIYKNIYIPNPKRDVFICEKEDGTLETLDENGNKIFENFENVNVVELVENRTYLPYEKNALKYEDKGKYGLINLEGKIITKPVYEEISSLKYREGEFLAKKNGKYGVISMTGKQIIPFEYDWVEADKDNKNNYEKTGYIVKIKDSTGEYYGYIDYNRKEDIKNRIWWNK